MPVPTRLFVEGRFIGYKRSKVKQRTQWALLNIDGVASKEEAVWYQGKYAAYVYKALTKKGKEKMTKRVIWGKVCRPHGNKGVVRARFKRNLPSQAMVGTPLHKSISCLGVPSSSPLLSAESWVLSGWDLPNG
ncbi:unnamed protein product [Ostreobium quekettii]|uniref:60S ribosomal protein L35a n=1 Tax=Ostreobium quekettii TaxID=121088 RepID=A0A8S1IW73_9CHLO|nr:unnamed protein product [Ostreobium quekettii]